MRPRPIFLLWLVLVLAPCPVWGCLVAPPPGERVDILREDAVIMWNPATGMEHFIRRAQFDTLARAFGFLVPTPTRPELAEAPAALFAEMERVVAPPSIPWTLEPGLLLGSWFGHMRKGVSGPTTASSAAPVSVLEERHVGGYDAVVLAASDPAALSAWLKEHGFSGNDLTAWLAPYIARKWTITAFKISRDESARASTGVVRLSFKTDHPFYPYREPAQPKNSLPRLLRVYFIGDTRVKATIGENGPRLPGDVDYAAQPKDLAGILLAGAIPLDGLPVNAWLTSFRDPSSPRPGTDEVYFSTDPSQEKVIPAPVLGPQTTRIPVPLDVIAALIIVCAFLFLRKKSKKA